MTRQTAYVMSVQQRQQSRKLKSHTCRLVCYASLAVALMCTPLVSAAAQTDGLNSTAGSEGLGAAATVLFFARAHLCTLSLLGSPLCVVIGDGSLQDAAGYYPTNVAPAPEFAPGRNPYGNLKNVIVDWNLVCDLTRMSILK